MGGIGKTHIALAYTYTYRKDYERIYWITAVHQASLFSGYQTIAKNARISLQDSSPTDVAKAVIMWLERKKKWLLVIDNLDDIGIIKGLLPENAAENHTLITTRNPNSIGIPAIGFEVPLLDMTSSIALLSAISGVGASSNSDKFNQASGIVQDLEYLPLAIEQAAAFVREVTGDFATFREMYNARHEDVHKWVSQGNRTYSYSVATAWLMSFKAVRKSDVQAAKLVQLLAFLNPDCILIDFLIDGAQALDNDLRDIIMNRTRLARTLIELEKFSLIKWDRPANVLSIHRLIQTVIKDEMLKTEWTELCNFMIDICYHSFPHEVTNETRPLCRRYQSQVMLPLLQLKNVNTIKLSEILKYVGIFLQLDGKSRDAEIFHKREMEIRCNIYGADHPSTLASMHSLASAYRSQGRLTDASKLQEEVLNKRRIILGEDHLFTLTSMSSLAMTYRIQGKLTDASKLQEEVFQKREITLGGDHPDTLISMNNLALTYRDQGRLIDAIELQEEVLRNRRLISEEDHPETLTCMNNLALMYRDQGRSTDAVRLQEKVLQKRKTILGEDHPDTLISMNRLASTYHIQGKLEDASKLQEDVLQKRMAILGVNHPDTLISMNNLALTYCDQGKLTDGVNLQEEVLQKRRAISGEDHPQTLTCMSNLALTYRDQGRMTDAVKIQEVLLRKRKIILGEDHPETLISMNRLASMYQNQGRLADAAKLQEEVLQK